MAINIVKLENGNVALYDNGTGDFLRSLSADYVELECNVNGNVKLIQNNGNVEFFTPALVANTQVLPAAAVPFAGTCADLAELLATDFFFELTGGGVEYQYNKDAAIWQSFTETTPIPVSYSNAIAPNLLLGFPIVIKEDCTIERLKIKTTVNRVGNSVWGLYDAVDGLPNSLLFQSTALDNNVVGVQTYTLGTTYKVKTGLYYVVYNSNSVAGHALSCSPTSSIINCIGGDVSDVPSALLGRAYTYTGTLPATFGTVTNFYNSVSVTSVPLVQFKVS